MKIFYLSNKVKYLCFLKPLWLGGRKLTHKPAIFSGVKKTPSPGQLPPYSVLYSEDFFQTGLIIVNKIKHLSNDLLCLFADGCSAQWNSGCVTLDLDSPGGTQGSIKLWSRCCISLFQCQKEELENCYKL